MCHLSDLLASWSLLCTRFITVLSAVCVSFSVFITFNVKVFVFNCSSLILHFIYIYPLYLLIVFVAVRNF